MARRYSSRNNNSDLYRRKPVAPQDVPEPINRTQKKWRFDIIIIAVMVMIGFLILEPYLNAQSQEAQTVSNAQNEVVTVDFPIISEVMSSNRDALAAGDGNYYDWVEVFNPTANAINLAGFSLSDDMEDPAKYVFPSIILQPGEFAVVFLSGGAMIDPMHGAFKVSSQGETLYIYDQHANVKDSVQVDHLAPNAVYRRNLAILDSWEVSEQYTPGFYNDETGWDMFMATRVIYDSPLKINEVMSSNLITVQDCDGEFSDWVELINMGTEPIYLGGYALSDSATSTREWIFPEITLHPNEYLVIFLSGKDKVDPETGEIHTNFRLNSMEDMIVVSNIRGQILDQWKVEGLGDDRSMGRVVGEDTVSYFSHPTPGYENTEDGYNRFQKERDLSLPSGLMISEVMMGNSETLYDGEDTPDWIEIHNPTEEQIDLSGYMLTDDPSQLNKWKFPDHFFINPGEYLLVYASGKDDTGTGILHTNFSLDLTGEPVILADREGNVLDTCILSPMPYDISYGRTGDAGTYQYMLYSSPGEANGVGWPGFAPDPRLPVDGGIYTDSMVISINVPQGARVYYTTDCSNPSDNSSTSFLYEGPFQIDSTTIVRAKAYMEGKLPSNIVTATYFIGVDHKLPIVSISSDPDNLFSDHAGIYAFGERFDKKRIPFRGANFNEDWEVPAYLEMFEIDGSQALDQGIGLRIFGAFSRAEIKKSFTIVSRAKYGPELLDYPIFPDRPFSSYKSVILRNGASEWYSSMIRDTMLTSLARDTTDLDVQAYYPVVIYLNGQYWGVYFFREKLNKYYVQQHYGTDADNVDIIYGNGTSSRHAVNGTNENWLDLRDYVKNNDLSDPAVYQKVSEWVDIDNYIDMVTNEIYVGNADTGNIKCYRENVEGAKWRWFYYDVDWGFFYTTSANASSNNLIQYLNEEGHGAGDGFETWLIMGLLENPEFERKFIERLAYHINVTYNPDRVIERIEEIYDVLDPEMELDRAHWDSEWRAMPDWYHQSAMRPMSYAGWAGKQKERLITFANQRPAIMKVQMREFFDIDDAWAKELFGE